MTKRNRSSGCIAAIRKFFLSAFVIISFIAYALEKKIVGIPATGAAIPTIPLETAVATGIAATPAATTAVVTPATSSSYKDGTYTGPSVFVNWGYVQIQVTIQGSKISNVQFLQYPSDRRTSVRINSIAVPELQQEAIQAQSANVDLITGATLTSEGFAQSLQSALDQAKS